MTGIDLLAFPSNFMQTEFREQNIKQSSTPNIFLGVLQNLDFTLEGKNLNNKEAGNELNSALKDPLLRLVELDEEFNLAEVDLSSLFPISIFVEETQSTHLSVETLQQELTLIMIQFEKILSEVTSSQDIKKISTKVLELLEKWQLVEGKLTDTNHLKFDEMKEFHTKTNTVWKEILQVYQNREKLQIVQPYQNLSMITTKDITKWLEHALQNQGINLQDSSTQTHFHTNTVLPTIQQYMVFMNPHENIEVRSQQLVKQFQQVLTTSKFLSMPNGMNQLSISIRPEKLGEMMVRLVEQNGEMTVKIIVSTQAAKEMLESNLNQLRHLFAPHQMTIEKQEISINQEQHVTKEQERQEAQDENPKESKDSRRQQDKKQSNTFLNYLDEWLENMNE